MQAQVDVGNGNLLVTVEGLALAGVEGPTTLGAYYNSAASQATPVSRLGRGWGLDFTPDVRVVQNSDNTVTVHLPGGLTGVFTSTSATAYSSPAGFKMTLTKTSSGWRLVEIDSQAKLVFGSGGALTQVLDRNNNATTVTASGSESFPSVAVRTPAGGNDARAGNVSTTTNGDSSTTTVSQGASSALRSVTFDRIYDDATSFTDARGRTTTFGYANGGLLTQIAAPGGVTTRFGYDTQRRVTSITQVESSTGGPGNSVTRLAYPSAMQTLLAQPNTNQAQAVTAVPRTTYTLNGTQRVTRVVDEAGRQQSTSYTANFDVASASQGSSTQTNTWGANAGQSLTASQSPTGSTQSLSYGSSSGPAQYSPTGGTDDAGNASTYGYDGAGNQLTRTDAASAQARTTRNSDGTVATATSPGNGSNSTRYGYTNRQVTSMTPVTGSTLGARNYTYDQLGRLRTATNGRGITTTYGYNANDQVTSIGYTGGSVITYDYDDAGRNNLRAENSGTTTYGYDQLGRLISRQNSAHGGAVTYSYDKSSNLITSRSESSKTVRYSYDAANEPTEIEYPNQFDNTTGRLRFTSDSQGRRTGTYLEANADLSEFSGRSQVTYDASGRVSGLTADRGPSQSNFKRIVELTYCYKAGSTPAGGCTGPASADRDKLVWERDHVANKSTVYTYDNTGRLTRADVTGGNNPTTYRYGFDARGNRTSANSQSLSFNAGNQITNNGYSFDAAGNQTADPTNGTSSIRYSPADQVASVVKDGTTYEYAHAGTDNTELLRQTSPDGTYRYTYGRDAQTGVPVIEQVDRTTLSNRTDRAIIISDPVTGEPLMLRTSAGMNVMYVQNGTVGAPIAMINVESDQPAGFEYDPYGVPSVTENNGGNALVQNPYTFDGTGVRDRTTDWVHYGTRYYNPRTGTFTQQDTVDAPLDPLVANRYSYAAGDPINLIDPTGRCPAVPAAAGFSAAAAGFGVVALTVPGAQVPAGLAAAAAGAGAAGAGLAAYLFC